VIEQFRKFATGSSCDCDRCLRERYEQHLIDRASDWMPPDLVAEVTAYIEWCNGAIAIVEAISHCHCSETIKRKVKIIWFKPCHQQSAFR
jgi:hypothetical protein